MHKVMSTGLACIAALLLLCGCSAHNAAPTSTTAEEKIFEGTPVEWTTLYRACLEEGGLTTADLPDGDPSGFLVAIPDTSEEQRKQVTAACQKEIGMAPVEGLSPEELQRRYDARVAQFECLADLGLVGGPPISFEKFVDDYNRSGQRILWEPTVVDGEGIRVEKDGRFYGGTDLCPRDPSVW